MTPTKSIRNFELCKVSFLLGQIFFNAKNTFELEEAGELYTALELLGIEGKGKQKFLANIK